MVKNWPKWKKTIFHFFKMLFLWVVKGQKMVQNDKKFCLLCWVSQEPYLIWLLFMVYMCKMIFLGIFFFFHFFKISIFRVVSGVKGQKVVQNDKKFCLPHIPYLRNNTSWFSFMVHMWKVIVSPGGFFVFSSFDFLGC